LKLEKEHIWNLASTLFWKSINNIVFSQAWVGFCFLIKKIAVFMNFQIDLPKKYKTQVKP